MPSILHRLSIDAPPQRVHDLVASTSGVQQWWTGCPVAGNDAVGGRIEVYFGDRERAAAAFEIVDRAPQRVGWRCVDGPREWLGTRITYELVNRDDGGTTLLFGHRGWAEETEFMSGCSTNWAAYLMSLKAGAETDAFTPYPGGEVSRWD